LEPTLAARMIARARSWSAAHVLLGVYAIALLPIYCLPVCTPDETWFANDARMFADSWRDFSLGEIVLGQKNHLGYGAIYWIGYALLNKVTAHPLVLMRCVALAANLTIPFLLARSYRHYKQPAALLAMLLWFSFTAAWWTGKVTGPELLSVAMVFAGLHTLSRANSASVVTLCGVLLGLGVGLKSNAAPAAICCLFILPQIARPWRALGLLTAGSAAGLLLSNPFLLAEPLVFLANIRRHDKFGAGYTTNHLAEVMWNTNWEWEGVFRGGYFNWGMSPLALPIYLIFLWKSKLPWHWFLGGFACTVMGTLLFLTSRAYQGWYWLPLVMLFPLTVAQIRKVDASVLRWGFALVAVNLVGNAPWISMQYHSKIEQFAHSLEMDNVVREAQQIAAARRDGLLLTILDNGVELNEQETTQTEAMAKPISDLTGFFMLNELRFGRRELAPGESWIVIHDRRLRDYNPIVDPQRDEVRFAKEYEVELQHGVHVDCLRIHRRTSIATGPGAAKQIDQSRK
jgi:hypothetical protein